MGKTMKTVFFAVLITLLGACASVAGVYPERAYQRRWCVEHRGVMEYVLPDRTRVDCVTADYAVEVDFARKWAEAVGQSLYYAKGTSKKPGIVLIMEDEKDSRFLRRLDALTGGLGITVWTITPADVAGGVE